MAEEEDTETFSCRRPLEREHWLGRLIHDGFGKAEAEILVDTRRLDLHQVEAAVDDGCPLDLAFLIFS